MSDHGTDLVIAGLALVTVVTRSFFLVIGDRLPLPPRIQQGLRYAPVCALVAIVAPQLLLTDPPTQLSFANPRLGAALIAGAVMLWRRDMLTSMCAGMAAFLLLRVLI
jgi:branched-subunit amino acid transport protein